MITEANLRAGYIRTYSVDEEVEGVAPDVTVSTEGDMAESIREPLRQFSSSDSERTELAEQAELEISHQQTPPQPHPISWGSIPQRRAVPERATEGEDQRDVDQRDIRPGRPISFDWDAAIGSEPGIREISRPDPRQGEEVRRHAPSSHSNAVSEASTVDPGIIVDPSVRDSVVEVGGILLRDSNPTAGFESLDPVPSVGIDTGGSDPSMYGGGVRSAPQLTFNVSVTAKKMGSPDEPIDLHNWMIPMIPRPGDIMKLIHEDTRYELEVGRVVMEIEGYGTQIVIETFY